MRTATILRSKYLVSKWICVKEDVFWLTSLNKENIEDNESQLACHLIIDSVGIPPATTDLIIFDKRIVSLCLYVILQEIGISLIQGSRNEFITFPHHQKVIKNYLVLVLGNEGINFRKLILLWNAISLIDKFTLSIMCSKNKTIITVLGVLPFFLSNESLNPNCFFNSIMTHCIMPGESFYYFFFWG